MCALVEDAHEAEAKLLLTIFVSVIFHIVKGTVSYSSSYWTGRTSCLPHLYLNQQPRMLLGLNMSTVNTFIFVFVNAANLKIKALRREPEIPIPQQQTNAHPLVKAT